MELKKTYLLGVVDNTILTCEIEKRYKRNNYNEVSISFNVGELINITNIDEDYTRDYFEEMFDCMDSATKIDWLENGDITKDEWIDNQVADCNYRDICDCSCTDYEILIKGTNYNFETTCCGQHDIREQSNFKDFVYTNKKAFNLIMELWDNFHIKKLSDEENKKVDNIIEEITRLLNDYDCDDFENNNCYKFVVSNMGVLEND